MRVFLDISLAVLAASIVLGQTSKLTDLEVTVIRNALEPPGVALKSPEEQREALLRDATAASLLKVLLIGKTEAFAKERASQGVSLDFQIKGSSASMAIGASPDVVPSPTTLRAMAMSVINGLDREGNYKGGIGVEFAPLKDSIKGLKLSAALVKGAAKDDPSTRAGIGIRYSFIDKPDDDAPGEANDNVIKEREIMEHLNPGSVDAIVLGSLILSGAYQAKIDAFQKVKLSDQHLLTRAEAHARLHITATKVILSATHLRIGSTKTLVADRGNRRLDAKLALRRARAVATAAGAGGASSRSNTLWTRRQSSAIGCAQYCYKLEDY